MPRGAITGPRPLMGVGDMFMVVWLPPVRPDPAPVGVAPSCTRLLRPRERREGPVEQGGALRGAIGCLEEGDDHTVAVARGGGDDRVAGAGGPADLDAV